MKRLLCTLSVLLVTCAGCGRSTANFQIRKQAVTPADAGRIMREAKKDPPKAISRSDYPATRGDAIAAFVSAAEDAGAESTSLKEALEAVTPPASRSQAMPTRVVEAPFGGRKAWIIVQNWNMPGSDLTHVKVWAIGVKDQALLYAASER